MSVTKYWVDKNSIALPKEDIAVDTLPIQIWKKADESAYWEKVELVDLKAKDNWTYSWEAEDDGASWTVSEPTTPLGYTQLTIKQNRNNDNKTLNFRVTNQANADVTPAPRQLSVVKYWNHKDGTSLTEDEIGIESLPIRIYRKEKGEGSAWMLYDKIELTAENNWEYYWGAADDGADWTVTERDVPEGYELAGPIRTAHNAEWSKIQFRITNYPENEPDITATITPTPSPDPTVTPTNPESKKQINIVIYWKATDGVIDLEPAEVTPDSVAIKVYKKSASGGAWEEYKNITLTQQDNWSSSLFVDEDDSSWTITEEVPRGFEKVSIMQSGGSGKTVTFKITNKMTSVAYTCTPTPTPNLSTNTLIVSKVWQDASGQELTSTQVGISSLIVNIYKKAPGGTHWQQFGTIELLPSRNWTYSWTVPDDCSTWTVTEPNIPSGYTRKSITTETNSAQHAQIFTITNQKTHSVTLTPSAKRFSDVQDPTHPYYKAIYWAVDEGITKGYDDGTFGINKSCTRGEMIMFLWRFMRKPTPSYVSRSPFTDVPKSHTFYKAVLWAYQMGITKGYSD